MLSRFLLFLLIGFSLCNTSYTQTTVKWMSLEEAVEKSKTEKRKIFIDIYTDWCGWCKVMDRETFQNPCIANYLNRNYYPVKFNAEQKKDMSLRARSIAILKAGAVVIIHLQQQ